MSSGNRHYGRNLGVLGVRRTACRSHQIRLFSTKVQPPSYPYTHVPIASVKCHPSSGTGLSHTYALNSGIDEATPPAADDHVVVSEGYLGRIHVEFAPWVYSFDLGTWMFLAEGDWTTPATWAFVVNAAGE